MIMQCFFISRLYSGGKMPLQEVLLSDYFPWNVISKYLSYFFRNLCSGIFPLLLSVKASAEC